MTDLAVKTPVNMPLSTCGAHMYAQGFGTWQANIGGIDGAVYDAIKAGFRLIDCAVLYCNQDEVGKAISRAIDEGLVKRNELFIVSKVWNTDHDPNDVIGSTKQTIEDLKCDYLNLLLIHWPVPAKKTYPGYTTKERSLFFPISETGGCLFSGVPETVTWTAMESLVKDGLVKDIGLSNFNIEECEEIFQSCEIKPSVLQVECHAALPQIELRDYCEKKGMVFMSYCPLGVGMGSPENSLITNPEIKVIAKQEYGVEGKEVQLLLQYVNQLGTVCLSKSVTPERILQNAQVPYGGLSDKTMKLLAEFGKVMMAKSSTRVCNPPVFSKNKDELFFKV